MYALTYIAENHAGLQGRCKYIQFSSTVLSTSTLGVAWWHGRENARPRSTSIRVPSFASWGMGINTCKWNRDQMVIRSVALDPSPLIGNCMARLCNHLCNRDQKLSMGVVVGE
jgi:hypothetical protein